jgi:hypothetical protein
MANTTNYNWETPDDTDLVKDGAAAIRTLGSSIDTTTKNLNPETTTGDIAYRSATANTNTRLAIGTTGQVLTVVGGVPAWATSDDANAIQNAIVDAKGDIVAASAVDTPARLAVGTDNQRLIAASGETTGLKYVSDTQNTVIDAEGDLLVGDSADTLQRLPIGSNTHVLTVDTSVDGKIKWAAPAGGGKVLQVLQDTNTGIVSTNGTTFVTTNCAQSITPSATSSKVLVNLTLTNVATTNGTKTVYVTLRRNGTDIADLGSSIGYTPGTTSYAYGGTISISYLDSPATTSATTYEAFFKSSASGTTVYIGNYDASNTATSAIVVMEIGA